MVVAGDDYTDKVTQVDNLAKNIPSSTVIIIKNAGHFPWIEQPTQFFSGIIKWLKQHNVKENK
jgi:pimeloyl-ACP methyl ester carboxylesterase